MTKSAPALWFLFLISNCFSTSHAQVRRQVKPTPARLPAVMLPGSGKGPPGQQGLAPGSFCQCGTVPPFLAQIDAYFCLLVFMACPCLKVIINCNQQFGDEAGILSASLLAGRMLQTTRKRKRLRLTTN